MSNIKITVEFNGDALYRQILDAVNDPATMTEVHEKFAEIIDPWVPYDTGELSSNLTIDETGVTYNAYDTVDGYYSEKNYYDTSIRHKTEHHPLATAYWDKVAMQTEYDRFVQIVTEIIAKRLNNG